MINITIKSILYHSLYCISRDNLMKRTILDTISFIDYIDLLENTNALKAKPYKTIYGPRTGLQHYIKWYYTIPKLNPIPSRGELNLNMDFKRI